MITQKPQPSAKGHLLLHLFHLSPAISLPSSLSHAYSASSSSLFSPLFSLSIAGFLSRSSVTLTYPTTSISSFSTPTLAYIRQTWCVLFVLSSDLPQCPSSLPLFSFLPPFGKRFSFSVLRVIILSIAS